MFREIKQVKQERGNIRRRWFEADGIELVLWLAPGEVVDGFQICYNLGRGEHALTWRPNQGFTHSAVDQGDDSPFADLSPVLVPDGRAPWTEIRRLFSAHGGSLDPALSRWVLEKLGGTAESV